MAELTTAASNTIVFVEPLECTALSPAAALLRDARRLAKLSQAELARRAGVPASMVSAYERDLRQPSLVTLTRLVRAAGFDLRVQLVLAVSTPRDH